MAGLVPITVHSCYDLLHDAQHRHNMAEVTGKNVWQVVENALPVDDADGPSKDAADAPSHSPQG